MHLLDEMLAVSDYFIRCCYYNFSAILLYANRGVRGFYNMVVSRVQLGMMITQFFVVKSSDIQANQLDNNEPNVKS